MSTAQIRFSTDILHRLGEELNPSPDRGILELVKNAYDADARTCTIRLINTQQPGGQINITDDGEGMDLEDIEKGWLVVGRSSKSVKQRTQLGRIPAGRKGLGRLAALRMGTRAFLTTRPGSQPDKQYDLVIDWADYEEVDVVEEVSLTIKESKRKGDHENGSEIILDDVRSSIGRMDVKRLARALILLADPFGDDPAGFEPKLVAPAFSDLEALVQNRYFNQADYHLIAELDEKGYAHAAVVDWKEEALFSADHDELAIGRDKRPYNGPPVTFDLWVFILSGVNFSTHQVALGEVQAWLGEFGGVHIYENGLRVAPYGDPGNDWLDMNLRRAQSPEERPSTNTSIGRISITDTDGLLTQKTDRSGFVEGEAFLEVKTFAQDALEWLARRRLEVAEQRRLKERAAASAKSSKSRRSLERAIEKAPPESREVIEQAFEARERSHEKEIRALQREVQLYRTLSTVGITAATFAHESSGNPIKVITQSIKAIERRAKQALNGRYVEVLKKPVDGIKQSISALEVLGRATLRLLEHEKRRVGRVEVHAIIENVLATFEPFLKGRQVSVETDLWGGNPYLRGSTAAVESIITNLINNSLAAFERCHTAQRRILIRTAVDEDVLTLRVLDNGPGIKEINVKDIWLPGRTTQPNGTGLGLTIVRDAAKDLGGEVSAVTQGELGGAELIIELPILGV